MAQNPGPTPGDPAGDVAAAAMPLPAAEAPRSQILDPKANTRPKGRVKRAGSRIEAPGMAHLNFLSTKQWRDVATNRDMKSFMPLLVEVARERAEEYYLIPRDTEGDMVTEVKYSKSRTTCRIDLYPYLAQSGLEAPVDHHWFVPTEPVNHPTFGWSLLLKFVDKETQPIVRRGPRSQKAAE